MKYFYKVSWQDPKQPLMRLHENGTIHLSMADLENCDGWELVNKIRESHRGRYTDDAEFSVDFMLPIGL